MGQEILPKSVKLYKTALCVGVKLGAIMINILMQFVIIITKWGSIHEPKGFTRNSFVFRLRR